MVKEYIKEHLTRVIGTAIGLIIGVLFLTIGFWSTLLLALCTFAGYFLSGGEESRLKIFTFFNKVYNMILGIRSRK